MRVVDYLRGLCLDMNVRIQISLDRAASVEWYTRRIRDAAEV